MNDQKARPILTDYITGKEVPDIGAEMNRQAVEHLLVDKLGYAVDEISVDVPFTITVAGEDYSSFADLAITVEGRTLMLIKCAPGSLGSRERETLAAARLLTPDYQVPLALVTDGQTATLLDTLTGKKLDEGPDAIPSRQNLVKRLKDFTFEPLLEQRQEREKLIFRSYDMMTVNTARGTTNR